MFAGYLVKRTSPTGPTTILQRSYCCIWGTLLLEFESEDDFKTNVTPKSALEILGVSEWDGGQSRTSKISNTFLLVSHCGTRYYMTALSQADRDEWILHVRRVLECTFANPEISQYKPCKIQQSRAKPSFGHICAKTKNTITGSATVCRVCGRSYSLSEYVQETCPFLQIGAEESEKCCGDCKSSQACVIWLKALNYVHLMSLHEFTPSVQRDIIRFEASFSIRKRHSRRLQMASDLLIQNQITPVEFEELRRIDQEYSVESSQEESVKLGAAIDAIGEDVLMIIGLLTNPSSTEAGGRAAYFQVILKLLSVADKEPSVIDFYLPQLMQAHLVESNFRSTVSLVKVDLMQQAILALALKFPIIALKIAWLLMAVVADYSERKVTQIQYASCACLLLQLDCVINGLNIMTNDRATTSFMDFLSPAAHQVQEIAYEFNCLFAMRSRIHEMYEDEKMEYRRSKLRDFPSLSLTEPQMSEHAISKACTELVRELGTFVTSRSRPNQVFDNGNDKIKFGDQIDFINRLSELVESLRFIHRPGRTDALCKELSKWNSSAGLLGWDPTASAGDPAYRITRIVVEDCRVFRTKARAPSMIVCEVLRQDVWDDLFGKEKRHANDNARLSRLECPREADCILPVQMRKRTTSLLLPDGIDANHLFQADGINEVDGLVEQSISQVIADIQRSQEASEVQMVSSEPAQPLHVPHSSGPEDSSHLVGRIGVGSRQSSLAKSQSLSVYKASIAATISSSTEIHDETATKRIDSETRTIPPFTEMFKRLLPKSPTNSFPVRTLSPFALSGQPTYDNKGGESSSSEGGLRINNELGSTRKSSALFMSANRKHSSRFGVPIPAMSASPTQRSKQVSSSYDGMSSNVQMVVESAQQLLRDGAIDEAEYEVLVKSDCRYRDESARVDEEITLTRVESAYGETWAAKKERVLGSRIDKTQSERSHTNGNDWPVWDLRSFIVKSNDDLRQEVCCLQIMQLCKEVFEDFGLTSQLWLKPGRIVSTGSSTGIVQVIPDSMSLDALKKTAGFVSLPFYFRSTYGSSADRLQNAKRNFMSSLAAYSLFSYLLMVKDRHNGNILLDTEGHIIHIDFGFILSIAPGGSFSLETAPFKLTEEMVEVLGGLESKLFGEFVKAFTAGFLALRANAESIISTLQILSQNSPFPCFYGKEASSIIDKLRMRFRSDLSVKDVVQHCLDLIIASYGNYGTKQYDSFQWYTNGIVP